MPKEFEAFFADKAPEGAPNVLVVLYDDTGQRGTGRRSTSDYDARKVNGKVKWVEINVGSTTTNHLTTRSSG